MSYYRSMCLGTSLIGSAQVWLALNNMAQKKAEASIFKHELLIVLITLNVIFAVIETLKIMNSEAPKLFSLSIKMMWLTFHVTLIVVIRLNTDDGGKQPTGGISPLIIFAIFIDIIGLCPIFSPDIYELFYGP